MSETKTVTMTPRQQAQYEAFLARERSAGEQRAAFLTALVGGILDQDDATEYGLEVAGAVITLTPPTPDA